MAARQVIFHSRYTEHELLRVPKDQEPTRSGGWRTTQQRIAYQFHAAPAPDGQGGLIGVFAATVGRDKMKDSSGWLAADQDEDEVRDMVDAIRAHRAFGLDMWEAGHAPGTLYPRPVDFRRELMTAIGKLDEERLVAMIAEEQGSHARRELLDDATAALGTVRDELAQAAAAQEAANVPEWLETDSNAKLQAIADGRGLTVVGSGTNGGVVKADLVKALRESEAVAA